MFYIWNTSPDKTWFSNSPWTLLIHHHFPYLEEKSIYKNLSYWNPHSGQIPVRSHPFIWPWLVYIIYKANLESIVSCGNFNTVLKNQCFLNYQWIMKSWEICKLKHETKQNQTKKKEIWAKQSQNTWRSWLFWRVNWKYYLHVIEDFCFVIIYLLSWNAPCLFSRVTFSTLHCPDNHLLYWTVYRVLKSFFSTKWGSQVWCDFPAIFEKSEFFNSTTKL